jgi:hypothetical protein
MSGQSSIPAQVMTEETTLKGISKAPRLQGHNKTLTGHLAPRGKGGSSFGGRFSSQPRRLSYLFCGEDKGYTTRTCQVTIQKQKEIAEAEARQNQPKQVLHIASCYSPYIPECPQHQLLWQVILKLHGSHYHNHHLWHRL